MLFKFLHCTHPQNISMPCRFNIIIRRVNVIICLASFSCKEIDCTGVSNVGRNASITCLVYRYILVKVSWRCKTSTRRRWWVLYWYLLDPRALRELSFPLIKGYEKIYRFFSFFFLKTKTKIKFISKEGSGIFEWEQTWGRVRKHLLCPLMFD